MRDELRLKYQQDGLIMPIQIRNAREVEFWRKLQPIVKDNLANTTFGAEDFARSMHMSRMQLHRKLKAMTGVSLTIFIRQNRLRVATKLLQNSDLSMAQIAYDVGFTSPSYFTKCFREKYLMKPLDYARTKKEESKVKIR